MPAPMILRESRTSTTFSGQLPGTAKSVGCSSTAPDELDPGTWEKVQGHPGFSEEAHPQTPLPALVLIHSMNLFAPNCCGSGIRDGVCKSSDIAANGCKIRTFMAPRASLALAWYHDVAPLCSMRLFSVAESGVISALTHSDQFPRRGQARPEKKNRSRTSRKRGSKSR